MRGFMQKPCLRLLAGFAFAQIMFLGNESPFAMKHQRPVCHLVEAREKARWMHGRPAEVGFNACRPTAFWGDGVSGRRLELAIQNTWLAQFRSPQRVWAARMLCPWVQSLQPTDCLQECSERWKSPAAGDVPPERPVSGDTLRLRRERQSCGPANAGPQPVVLCLNLAQIN